MRLTLMAAFVRAEQQPDAFTRVISYIGTVNSRVHRRYSHGRSEFEPTSSVCRGREILSRSVLAGSKRV